MRAVTIVMLAAVFGSGCGAAVASSDDSRAAAATDSPAEDAGTEGERAGESGAADETVGSSGSVGFLLTPANEPPDLEALFSVFARPPTAADLEAARFATGWFAYDPQLELGGIRFSAARVLLDGLGGEEDILYAVPTNKGNVCIGLAPNGGSSCGAVGPGGFGLGWTHDPARDSFVVYGIVSDDVAAVDLILSGRAHRARLGENGYALRTRVAGRDELEAAVLHFRDGSSERIDLT